MFVLVVPIVWFNKTLPIFGPLQNPSLTGEECFREAQEIMQESLDPDPESWIQEHRLDMQQK